MVETIKNIEEMKSLAERFVSNLTLQDDRATVVGLYGDLGAGKTTFTKALADVLGVTEVVNSPTFVLMKMYTIHNFKCEKLIHIDAYRLEKSAELENLGWASLIADPKNFIVIEWPERVSDVMPEHIQIKFEHKSESERMVEIIYA